MTVSLLQQRAIDLSSPTSSYRSHLRVGGAWRRVDVVRRGEYVQKGRWTPHAFNLVDVCLREALDFGIGVPVGQKGKYCTGENLPYLV